MNAPAQATSSGLRQRAVTAALLAPLAVALVLFVPNPWFALALGVLCAFGLVEWARLIGWRSVALQWLVGAVGAALMAGIWYGGDRTLRGALVVVLFRNVLGVPTFGTFLPALIAAEVPLADWPWLADLARLDWALHRAAQAADGWLAQADLPPGLSALAEPEAVHHQLLLQPGLAVLRSSWPVVALWQAHPCADTVDAALDAPASRVQAVEAALAWGTGECAAVGRRGWHADVQRLSAAEAGFMLAVLDGQTLGDALEAAGEGFDFASWLQRALQSGWIIALRPRPGAHAGDLST